MLLCHGLPIDILTVCLNMFIHLDEGKLFERGESVSPNMQNHETARAQKRPLTKF